MSLEFFCKNYETHNLRYEANKSWGAWLLMSRTMQNLDPLV